MYSTKKKSRRGDFANLVLVLSWSKAIVHFAGHKLRSFKSTFKLIFNEFLSKERDTQWI